MGKLTNLKIKRNDKIGAFFFVAFVLSSSLIWLFEERFNVEQWKTQPRTRYKMAEDIIDNNLMIGKSKQEILVLLGNPQSSTLIGKDHLVYRLGKPQSFFEAKEEKLVIIFENNLVTKVIQTEE